MHGEGTDKNFSPLNKNTMNRPEVYERSINILLDAYNNGTLTHGRCSACAVGNLLNGIERWRHLFMYSNQLGCQQRDYHLYKHNASVEDDARRFQEISGYTLDELADIELAFEGSIVHTPVPDDIDPRLSYFRKTPYVYWSAVDTKRGQYIGLCAVLDLLAKIHAAPEEARTESRTRLNSVAVAIGVAEEFTT